MLVRLIGPAEDHESEHKIDAASAVALFNQLSKGASVHVHNGTEITTTGPEPSTLFLDDEQEVIEWARVKFFTTGPDLTALLTIKLAEKAP